MKDILNPHLFRHRETATAAFNNLCAIVHRLRDEGLYAGEVLQGERLLGAFRLSFDSAHETSQVNVDVSTFDSRFHTDAPGLLTPREYAVGREGYVVFHATGHQIDLRVTLARVQKDGLVQVFDSRQLGKGDLIALRLWCPGTYTLTNELGGHRAEIAVRGATHSERVDMTKLEVVRATLSERGFEPQRIEQWPLQAFLIEADTAAALTLKFVASESVDAKSRAGR